LATRQSAASTEAVALLTRAVSENPSNLARAGAVWALTRIGSAEAQAAVRRALSDPSNEVRQAAASSAGTTGDAQAAPLLVERLASDDDQAVRREAATTLGRFREKSAVPALLANLRAVGYDRAFEHALIYSLIEIADRDQTLPGLSDPLPQVRRAALIALDQMDGGLLSQGLVTPLLDSDDPALVQAALDVIGKHPTWAGELTSHLRSALAGDLTGGTASAVRGALLAFCREPATQELIAEMVADEQAASAARVLLLEVVARSGLSPWPEAWIAAVRAALKSGDEQVLRQAIATAALAGEPTVAESLRTIVGDAQRPHDVRVAATESVASAGGELSAALFELVTGQLDEGTPPLARLAAAEAIARAKLTPEQLAAIAEKISTAGPLELPALARAFDGGTDRELGLKLIAALANSPGATSLSPARIKELARDYPTEVQAAAGALSARQTAARAEQLAHLDTLEQGLPAGDPTRGHALFLSTRISCAGCHRVGQEGAQVGPDLSKIGAIRTRRDLLESILVPSLSLSRGYESYTVETAAGLTHTGLLTRQTADAVWLRTPERAEVRIAREDVAELAPSPQSIMPEGLQRLLTNEQLADLLAWLESLK